MTANDRQVGGSHYQAKHQHWDMVIEHDLNYFEAQITKYVMRCRKKNGLQDLQKAMHFLEKYMENWETLNKLPAEVVRVMPRGQDEIDAEYAEQGGASALFQADGYTIEGTRYQCVFCRGIVTARSPLGAVAAHRATCPGALVKRPSQAPSDAPLGYAGTTGPARMGQSVP